MAIEIIDLGANFFSYFGAVLIFYGGVVAFVKTVAVESGKGRGFSYHEIRRDFTHKIIFGLDFLIASDILKTIVAPTREDIILLGAIVVIRTLLGYFLSKEISEFVGS